MPKKKKKKSISVPQKIIQPRDILVSEDTEFDLAGDIFPVFETLIMTQKALDVQIFHAFEGNWFMKHEDIDETTTQFLINFIHPSFNISFGYTKVEEENDVTILCRWFAEGDEFLSGARQEFALEEVTIQSVGQLVATQLNLCLLKIKERVDEDRSRDEALLLG